MCKVSCVLFTLLLISSCGLLNKMKESKEVMKIQKGYNDTPKTLEEELRGVLSESQNKGLDFLKKVLKGGNDKLNSILSVGKDKLGKLRVVLDGIQSSIEKCDDSRNNNIIDGFHDINAQREGFKELVVEYVETHLGLRKNTKIHSSGEEPPVPSLGNICVN